MTREEILSQALDGLFEAGLGDYRASGESCLAQEALRCFDKTREQLFSPEQNRLLEEWLFQLCSIADAQTRALYLRGMEDCLWLLRRGMR